MQVPLSRERVYACDTRVRARGRQVFAQILERIGVAPVQRTLNRVGWVYVTDRFGDTQSLPSDI